MKMWKWLLLTIEEDQGDEADWIHVATCDIDFLHMNAEAINLIDSSSPLGRKDSWCYFRSFVGGRGGDYFLITWFQSWCFTCCTQHLWQSVCLFTSIRRPRLNWLLCCQDACDGRITMTESGNDDFLCLPLDKWHAWHFLTLAFRSAVPPLGQLWSGRAKQRQRGLTERNWHWRLAVRGGRQVDHLAASARPEVIKRPPGFIIQEWAEFSSVVCHRKILDVQTYLM